VYLVTAQEMRALDRHTIDVLGIPSLVLMENAGRKVAEQIQTVYPSQRTWLVLVGKGNNGGDGLVAARHLTDAGYQVDVLYAVDPALLTGDAAVQRDIVSRLGIPSFVYGQTPIDWSRYDGVVDALLGTGSRGTPKEPYASLIAEANGSHCRMVAIDIPSGLDADTGTIWQPCIQADWTVTLGFAKRGLYQFPGREKAGKIVVVPIGIPQKLPELFGIRSFSLNPDTLEQMAIGSRLVRPMHSHKGNFGHVLVVAGSKRMTGAGLLCCKSALRAGCGLVTWALPESLVEGVSGHVPEIMYAPIHDPIQGEWTNTSPDAILALASDKDVVVIGPGMGRFEHGSEWLEYIWRHLQVPLVVDADGLNLLANRFHAWGKRQAPTIFTPHPGEMARLLQASVQDIQSNRLEIARSFAVSHGVTLVLKGAGTVIATEAGDVYVNTTGNPGMASGGTGDVLSGLIGGLLAQSWSPVQAACTGVYIHGLAGDLAAERLGNSLLASDVVEELGRAFRTLSIHRNNDKQEREYKQEVKDGYD
jgi:ADP-dependent NAD(P)H-hydrate dehydratase / NAD(P)H-hydrate epimerase